jgi:hypothetical protein
MAAAHRIIKLQLSDLNIGHDYSVFYSVHNIDALTSDPLLDKTQFDFKAWADRQNAFLHFAHDILDKFITIKVNVFNHNLNEWSQLFVNVACEDLNCYSVAEQVSSGYALDALNYLQNLI